MSDTWSHKDIWVKRGPTFTIEVSRHSFPIKNDEIRTLGPNRWCVYAYIYPTHPFFEKCKRDGGRRISSYLPLHSGCTYRQTHRDGKKITSYQIGADYSHLYDEHYSEMYTAEHAHSVFFDARTLYAYLEKGVLE